MKPSTNTFRTIVGTTQHLEAEYDGQDEARLDRNDVHGDINKFELNAYAKGVKLTERKPSKLAGKDLINI